jgi:hypothetical protein
MLRATLQNLNRSAIKSFAQFSHVPLMQARNVLQNTFEIDVCAKFYKDHDDGSREIVYDIRTMDGSYFNRVPRQFIKGIEAWH